MPFIDANEQPVGGIRPLPPETPEPDAPALTDTLGAAFRLENSIGSALAEEDALE